MKGNVSSPTARQLPQDVDSERAILGAVLVNNELFHTISDKLVPEDFALPPHQAVYAAMVQLAQGRQPLDELTLKNVLESMRLDEPVTLAYLTSLSNGFPRLENIIHYVEIIKQKAILRNLIRASESIAEISYAQERSAIDVLQQAESWIGHISESFIKKNYMTLSDALEQAYRYISQLYEAKTYLTGIPTGFRDLDQMTCGLQRGELIIIAARPSMGKTSFALNLALHAALKEKLSVAVFSLEMSARQLALRLLSAKAPIDGQKLRSGYFSKSDWEEIGRAVAELDQSKIYIDETANLTLLELMTKARRLKKQYKLDMVIVDYLQLLAGNQRYENRVQEIAAISRSLKAMAKELDAPVVALSQLSRAPETRKGDHRPMLADLRESGSLEQDADVVMFIYRGEVYEKDDPDLAGKAELIIAKQRNGPVASIDLAFQKEFSRFVQMDPRGGRPTET